MDKQSLTELKSNAFDLQRVINHYSSALQSVLKQIEVAEANQSKAEPEPQVQETT